MKSIKINNGTITKRMDISHDPKREGCYIARCFDENNHFLGTLYGKKNQQEILSYLNE